MSAAARPERRPLFAALLLGLTLALAMIAGAASAEPARCRAYVNATEVVIDYDPAALPPVSRRERILDWPVRTWDRAWGAPPQCDSQTIIAFLSMNLPQEEIGGYCLVQDPTDDSYLLVPGERNYRGHCQKTICDRVNATRESVQATMGAISRAVAATARLDRMTYGAVSHSSGALIASGSETYLATTLQGAGSAVTAALASPVVLSAASASAVVVGGAVYICRD